MVGASELRVRMQGKGEQISLELADQSGQGIARVGSLRLRQIDPAQLQGPTTPQEGLLGVEWVEASAGGEGDSQNGASPRLASIGGLDLAGIDHHESLASLRASLEGEDEPPALVLWRCQPDPQAKTLSAATQTALELVQEWLECEALADSRLVILTEGGVAAKESESPDLATAPLWGLRTKPRFMHDLRSLSLEDAISRHQGEASERGRAFHGRALCIRHVIGEPGRAVPGRTIGQLPSVIAPSEAVETSFMYFASSPLV